MSQLAQRANFGGGVEPIGNQYGQNVTDSATAAVTDLETLISNGIGFLTIIAGLFFIFFFFLGALKWVTAGGDSGKVGKARDEMVQGVMGLVVIVAAYGIIGLIGRIIGLDLLRPGQQIIELITR